MIECPSCGKFAEARTGFFARKKIDCACGYTINVHTDKLTSRECPHCGNMVVFDQSRGEQAKCPVCGEPINTQVEQTKTEEFSCAQCGVRLRTSKAAETYVCPVCDFENDVRERLMSEKIKHDGLASVIKYEGDNETLVWKHPIEDFNMGSQLIVHESQEAIFFRDGQALDLFGPGRYTLETQQLPILEKLFGLDIAHLLQVQEVAGRFPERRGPFQQLRRQQLRRRGLSLDDGSGLVYQTTGQLVQRVGSQLLDLVREWIFSHFHGFSSLIFAPYSGIMEAEADFFIVFGLACPCKCWSHLQGRFFRITVWSGQYRQHTDFCRPGP